MSDTSIRSPTIIVTLSEEGSEGVIAHLKLSTVYTQCITSVHSISPLPQSVLCISGWQDYPVTTSPAAILDPEPSRHTQAWLQKERKLWLTCRGTSSMRAMDLELILVSKWRHRTSWIHHTYSHFAEFYSMQSSISGGSVMKCAYIHKDDWIENAKDRKQVRVLWLPVFQCRTLSVRILYL